MARVITPCVSESLEGRMLLSVANDPFAGRTAIVTIPAVLTDSNVEAAAEEGEPAHGGFPAERSVWWSWTAPKAGTYRITTAGSDFDTVLSVYRGKTLGTLKAVASDDDAGRAAGSSIVTIKVPARATYQITVDGYQGAAGDIVLSIARPKPLVINGTSEDDIINVSAEGADYIVDVNGTQTSYPISTVLSLRINGGAGNDRISLGERVIASSLYGGDGDDVLIGGDNADRIFGEDGNDEIYGSFGNDRIDGGDGNDSIQGQFGNDLIFGRRGDDLLDGADGNDTINAGSGADTINAGSGNDRILARDRMIDTIDAGDDIDIVRADRNDLLSGTDNPLR